jgi:hypothetical protein
LSKRTYRRQNERKAKKNGCEKDICVSTEQIRL